MDIKKNKTKALDNLAEYHGSTCYASLEKNVLKMRRSLDYDFSSNQNYDIQVIIPMVLPVATLRTAIIAQNFREEPFLTFTGYGETPAENARSITDVVSDNLKDTRFRAKCFRLVKEYLGDYGTAAIYSYPYFSESSAPRTVIQNGMQVRADIKSENIHVINKAIHPLDYIQSPDVQDLDDSTYSGHITRVSTYSFIAYIKDNPDLYDKKAVEKVLKQLKDSGIKDSKYSSCILNKNNTGSSKGHVDVVKLFFYDNDGKSFYAEIVAGEVIRIHENPNDKYVMPYATLTYYRRPTYWWGNADAAHIIPHEDFSNILLSLKAKNAVDASSIKMFYPNGLINPFEFEKRKFIGYDPMPGVDLQKMIFPLQYEDRSINSADSIMNYIMESKNTMTKNLDNSRTSEQGGMKYTTATAASYLADRNMMLEQNVLSNIEDGFRDMAINNVILLQQHKERDIKLRPGERERNRSVPKELIMGDFDANINTSLTASMQQRMMEMQNLLTFLMNAQGTGHPAFAQINLEPIIREALRNAKLPDKLESVLPININPEGFVPSDQNGGIKANETVGQQLNNEVNNV